MEFQDEKDNSKSENEMEEGDEGDERVEDDGDDDESEDSIDDDDHDDDISVVTEEDVLSDPSALAYTDVIKVSKQLDELCKLISKYQL